MFLSAGPVVLHALVGVVLLTVIYLICGFIALFIGWGFSLFEVCMEHMAERKPMTKRDLDRANPFSHGDGGLVLLIIALWPILLLCIICISGFPAIYYILCMLGRKIQKMLPWLSSNKFLEIMNRMIMR